MKDKYVKLVVISFFISSLYFISSTIFLDRTVFEQSIVLKVDSGNKWNEWFKGVFQEKVDSALKDSFSDNFIRTGIYLHNDEKNKVIKIRVEMHADSSSAETIQSIINYSLIEINPDYKKSLDTQIKVYGFFENRLNRLNGLTELLLYSILLFVGLFVMLFTVWRKD